MHVAKRNYTSLRTQLEPNYFLSGWKKLPPKRIPLSVLFSWH
jgi:hypothetical protein